MLKRAPLLLAGLLVLLSASRSAAEPAAYPSGIHGQVLTVIDGNTIAVRIGGRTETVR